MACQWECLFDHMKNMISEAGLVKELREQIVELIFYADLKSPKNNYMSQVQRRKEPVVSEMFLMCN